MIRLSRMLATRLRRLANPPKRSAQARSAQARSAVADAWARLEHSLTAPMDSAEGTRRRELIEENTRLSLTLLGQQRRRAVARVLASCNGTPHTANEAVRIALSLAATLGEHA